MIKVKEFWGSGIDHCPNLDDEVNKWLETKKDKMERSFECEPSFKLIDIKYSIIPNWKIVGEEEIATMSYALVIYEEIGS